MRNTWATRGQQHTTSQLYLSVPNRSCSIVSYDEPHCATLSSHVDPMHSVASVLSGDQFHAGRGHPLAPQQLSAGNHGRPVQLRARLCAHLYPRSVSDDARDPGRQSTSEPSTDGGNESDSDSDEKDATEDRPPPPSRIQRSACYTAQSSPASPGTRRGPRLRSPQQPSRPILLSPSSIHSLGSANAATHLPPEPPHPHRDARDGINARNDTTTACSHRLPPQPSHPHRDAQDGIDARDNAITTRLRLLPAAECPPGRPPSHSSTIDTMATITTIARHARSDSDDWEPPAAISCAALLPRRLADKIRRGKYIIFDKLLLPTDRPSLSWPAPHRACSSRDKRATRVVTDFTSWTEAWNRYLCARLAAHPWLALKLAKYQTMIAMLFTQYPAAHCLRYDQLFRQAEAHDPTVQWDVL